MMVKMREKLKKIGGESRHTFNATFERFGTKRAFKGPDLTTLLFRDVLCDGKIVSDHLWFTMTKGFEKCELNPGDVIQFDGRVGGYVKGYIGPRDDDEIDLNHPVAEDFKIYRPTKISVVSRAEENR